MDKLKGGRGKKAPWNSAQDKILRCPEPIAEEVKARIETWKVKQLTGESSPSNEPVTSLDEAKEVAKKY